MNLSILLIAAAAQTDPIIIVTGAREPVEATAAPVSSTTFDEKYLETFPFPSAADVLRMAPGVSVAVTGPRGTQTQLRLRGAEANHSLLFVDGIRFNDPASGNEARFELMTTDLLSRIEVVRGPQSALWGSEAIGGVIAVDSADPFTARGLAALGEYGSHDSLRLFGRQGVQTGAFGAVGAIGWQQSDGFDSFGGGGDRDGFETLAASARAGYRGGPIELGMVGHWIEGRSEYDGFDPVTFRRADTLDETSNRIGATRAWARGEWDDWSARVEASYLDSANRNSLAGAPLNRTSGDRLTFGAQLSRRMGGHQLIAAIDRQGEDFRARDTAFFGGTDQDRSRSVTAFVGEWRADWTPWFSTDLAVRHDDFSAFEDATTLRAGVLVRPAPAWTLHGAYGEGIAQPTFFDLFGFFPGSFVGNPALQSKSSRSWEAGLRWQGARIGFGATAFSSRLRDEIVDVFDPATFLSSTANATGRSRRDGIELTADYRHASWLRLLANYTWLDAEEQRVEEAAQVREVRRPRHSANLMAFGEAGRFSWSTSLAYVGAREDVDFDLFPAQTVRLDAYWLSSLRLAYLVQPQLELFARVENGFDENYQDVVGYATPGRTFHAGLRVSLGR